LLCSFLKIELFAHAHEYTQTRTQEVFVFLAWQGRSSICYY